MPYALDRKMLFFGAFTGAGLLRSDPPDRYDVRATLSAREDSRLRLAVTGSRSHYYDSAHSRYKELI